MLQNLPGKMEASTSNWNPLDLKNVFTAREQ
jgi:hypothetical protein